MNYLYLRAFHTVATERSFTRAARVLRVGQPTLSWQVKALEDFYGVRLLDRRGNHVLPTEVGQQVLEKTREIYKTQDEIEAILDRFQTLKAGSLKVGADGPRHIMPVIHRFIEKYPEISVSLTTGNARKVLDDLLRYETDVAIVAMQKAQDSRLFMVPFFTYKLVAFVTRTHQWARRSSIPIHAFGGERIIVREPSSLTRQVFIRALNKAKVHPAALIQIDNREAGRDAVALGMGVGVMSDTEFRAKTRSRLQSRSMRRKCISPSTSPASKVARRRASSGHFSTSPATWRRKRGAPADADRPPSGSVACQRL